MRSGSCSECGARSSSPLDETEVVDPRHRLASPPLDASSSRRGPPRSSRATPTGGWPAPGRHPAAGGLGLGLVPRRRPRAPRRLGALIERLLDEAGIDPVAVDVARGRRPSGAPRTSASWPLPDQPRRAEGWAEVIRHRPADRRGVRRPRRGAPRAGSRSSARTAPSTAPSRSQPPAQRQRYSCSGRPGAPYRGTRSTWPASARCSR